VPVSPWEKPLLHDKSRTNAFRFLRVYVKLWSCAATERAQKQTLKKPIEIAVGLRVLVRQPSLDLQRLMRISKALE